MYRRRDRPEARTSAYLVAGACFLAVLAILFWPRKPPPVVGRVLPFPERKDRKRFESNRSA